MKFQLILLAFCATLTLATDPIPAPFPKVWSANFTEYLYSKETGHRTTKGVWYYNFELNKFRVNRENGAADEICGPLTNYKNASCHDIITDGKRYIYFPEIKSCCYCCSDADGCGMEKPTWFNTGKYLGKRYDSGYLVDVWDIQAIQANYLSQIAEGKYKGQTLRIFQVPTSNMVYDLSTLSRQVDSKVFDMPVGVNCQKGCPPPSMCAGFRASSSLKEAKETADE